VRIYADHAATTPVSEAALASMLRYLREDFGNPSEPHWAGRAARQGLDGARATVAAVLGVDPAEVVFTGGGSEADNLAILGRVPARERVRVVASPVEHPAVRATLLALAGDGHEVAWTPVDADGRIELDRLAELLRPGDALCCCLWANNVTGTVQPVAAIAELCAARGVPLHLDAVQAAAGVRVDLGALPGAVTAAFAAHKLGGPKGSGLLAGRGVAGLRAVLHGGGQERGLRPGTESAALAAGLATALVESQERDRDALRALRDAYETALLDQVDDVVVVARGAERLPGHSLALVGGVRGDTLVALLDEQGIAAAAGSACASGDAEPSHVLAAMGVPRARALGALRVSFGSLSEPDHAAAIAAAVAGAVPALRAAAAAVA
jgi:cysteine desulfurase